MCLWAAISKTGGGGGGEGFTQFSVPTQDGSQQYYSITVQVLHANTHQTGENVTKQVKRICEKWAAHRQTAKSHKNHYGTSGKPCNFFCGSWQILGINSNEIPLLVKQYWTILPQNSAYTHIKVNGLKKSIKRMKETLLLGIFPLLRNDVTNSPACVENTPGDKWEVKEAVCCGGGYSCMLLREPRRRAEAKLTMEF